MLASMAADPDANDDEIARRAKNRLADEHGPDDERVDFATPAAVERLRRALAVAALERRTAAKNDDE